MSKQLVRNRLKRKPVFHRTFIKQWREYRGLTQVALAERISAYLADQGVKEDGYDYSTLGRLENGKLGYTQLILEAIAHSLNCTKGDLTERDPTESEDLWSIVSRASKSDREKIVEIAKTIVGRTGTDG